ncbi:uncharacterized protein BO97DRAFT_442373 [Aspergillus homomorphus CBS 101889]|uniref:Uncharacterized protein n=1 Tax=Aspergillus homomorphus (strain CBS 101889) TaxID=1450537 RepID=A0A395I5V5_ASPHC|nr:hypothetical protein BO97DRAFT_442373 [Aspergillus homomorphus CBS 101889]RAL13724.1 hypothetical protein BO97DRAFT_442373 [Aspergillus homomorphus CBS 101889]
MSINEELIDLVNEVDELGKAVHALSRRVKSIEETVLKLDDDDNNSTTQSGDGEHQEEAVHPDKDADTTIPGSEGLPQEILDLFKLAEDTSSVEIDKAATTPLIPQSLRTSIPSNRGVLEQYALCVRAEVFIQSAIDEARRYLSSQGHDQLIERKELVLSALNPRPGSRPEPRDFHVLPVCQVILGGDIPGPMLLVLAGTGPEPKDMEWLCNLLADLVANNGMRQRDRPVHGMLITRDSIFFHREVVDGTSSHTAQYGHANKVFLAAVYRRLVEALVDCALYGC